jgi:hypothetical protein
MHAGDWRSPRFHPKGRRSEFRPRKEIPRVTCIAPDMVAKRFIACGPS